MTVITEKILEEILNYLEKSINNLATDAFDNLEIEGGMERIENFLQSQFEIRLKNLLISKSSSMHHLESAMKNKTVQRKQEIINKIVNQYKN